jgi:hypothetical protein
MFANLNYTHITPIDGSATYGGTSTTITCSGLPFTVLDGTCVISFILYMPNGGQWQRPLVNGVGGVSLKALAANTITVTGGGTPFAASDTYCIGFVYQQKAYTAATNSMRTEEINPLNMQYLSEVNTASAQPDGTYYYYYDMAGFQYIDFQIEDTIGTGLNTYTLWATLQDDGTAAASCTYQDVTTKLTGSASYITDEMIWIDTPTQPKYYMIRIVRTGDAAPGDGGWTIYSRKWY